MSIAGACKVALVKALVTTGATSSTHSTQQQYRRLRTTSGALGAKSKTNPGVPVYHRLSSWEHPLGVDHTFWLEQDLFTL